MSHNAPISHQLSPAPCWAAMSAASWPAANPSGDNVDLEVFGTEDEFVDVDQFFAEPPSAEWGVVNPSVVRSPLTIFNPSIAQPAPAVAEPSPAATWNDGMAQAPGALHGLEDVEEWNEVVVEALHPWLARGGGNLAQSKESWVVERGREREPYAT